jgi:hypothetical protein
MMPTMGHRTYRTGLLGQTNEQTLVKQEGRLSILSSPGAQGTQFIVVIDYGEITEEQVFPTEQRKANNGSAHWASDSGEVYTQFESLSAMYEGVTTDSSGIDPMKSGSFEELDQYLLSLPELPEDITIEMQRRGTANTGKPKRSINLEYSTSIITRFIGPKNDAVRMARIHYESYPKDARIGVLRDMRDRILSRYLTTELLSSILMSDRMKRDEYMRSIRAGHMPDISLANFMQTQSIVSADPIIAFRVRFIDQNGNEIAGLPYEASVRGVVNYMEALQKTRMGADPGGFSSGRMLIEQGMSDAASNDTTAGAIVEGWAGRSLDPAKHYHLLYSYRARGKSGTPRGTLKISITTPRNVTSTADWGNDRLKVYDAVSNASEKREGKAITPSPKMLIYSHNHMLEDGGDPQRMTITVPVHVAPLPMHLIESPPGSGNIVSRWSLEDDIGAIPSHQKTNLSLTVLRPKASDMWEEADKIAPSERDGYNDKFLQYQEFTSPQGRAAYREAIREASPVRGIRFVLMPNPNNSWTVAKTPIFMEPNWQGVMKAELVPGRYKLKMLVEIKADGTTGLRIITSSRDSEYSLGVRYDQLDTNLQTAVQQKYPDREMTRWTRFVPEVIDMGTIEAPAAFYYRKTTQEDTTPVGAAGVRLIKSGSMADTGSSRFRNFELKQTIPPLQPGKEPETGSIYDTLGVDYPAIDNGWPGADSSTDDRIFDTCLLMLSPDSSIDLSMLSAYERRYEAERDSSDKTGTRLRPPAVGQRIEYMGWYIEHAWFDTTVGPNLTNPDLAFGGNPHTYDMGRLETPFYDTGVIRLMCYYPVAGVMRRKMVIPADQNIRTDMTVIAARSHSSYNPQQATLDRVYHFEVVSSPEGAILSGRWCPLEVIGEGETPEGFEEILFENILKEIRRGGGPIRYLPIPSRRPSEADARQYGNHDDNGIPNEYDPEYGSQPSQQAGMGAIQGASGARAANTQYSVPKWNQFWSSTADSWLFTGGGGITLAPPVGGDIIVVDPLTALSGIATVNFETSDGPITEITHAPAPSYEGEEEFGFIGGGN